MSLAMLLDVLDSPRAREAHAWLLGAGAPYTDRAMLARSAKVAMMPRGQPRNPDQAPRCRGG
jgi:hypothetical protein